MNRNLERRLGRIDRRLGNSNGDAEDNVPLEMRLRRLRAVVTVYMSRGLLWRDETGGWHGKHCPEADDPERFPEMAEALNEHRRLAEAEGTTDLFSEIEGPTPEPWPTDR